MRISDSGSGDYARYEPTQRDIWMLSNSTSYDSSNLTYGDKNKELFSDDAIAETYLSQDQT